MTSAEVALSYFNRLNNISTIWGMQEFARQENFSYIETFFLPQGVLKSVRLGKTFCGVPVYIDTETHLLQVDNICMYLESQACSLLEKQYCSNQALIYSFGGDSV